MTIREASRQFHITEHEIETYEAKGFIEKSGDEYCDGDFRHLTTLRLLLNAGMGDGEIVRYLSLLDREGTQQAQIAILRTFRAKLLDRLHERQQALDHIDYIIYQIKK